MSYPSRAPHLNSGSREGDRGEQKNTERTELSRHGADGAEAAHVHEAGADAETWP